MKKLSKKQQEWQVYRSKKIQEKHKKRVYQSKKGVKSFVGNHDENYQAPDIFSFIENADETIEFFNGILNSIKLCRHSKKSIYIDIKSIKNVTIDAIMYLLTIINNLKMSYRFRIGFSGNMPDNPKLKQLITESGFYKYVRKENDDPVNINENNLQIVAGDNCNVEFVTRIVDFVSKRCSSKKVIDSLYSMLIELTSNTEEHAYERKDKKCTDKKGLFNYRWYCYANCCDDKRISFSFVDNGRGITTTVKRYIRDIFNNDNRYLISALDGKCHRSRIEKPNRGFGLPTIRALRKNNYIHNLHIITNKADIIVNENDYTENNINNRLSGTLFYWEIFS